MSGGGRRAEGIETDALERDRIRILHVDDDREFLDLTADYLETIGDEFSVVTETSVPDGEDALEREPVDCVLCDHEIPPDVGIEFLRTVREHDPDLPFILFTGKGDEGVASEAISAGVTDYLQKGSDRETFELLANRIRHAVEQYWTDLQLADLRALHERVARASSDAFLDWEITQDYFRWSEGIARPFGYTNGEKRFGLEWWTDRIHPEDRERVERELHRALDSGAELVESEYRFRRADGSYADTISRGYISSEGDEPVRVTGVLIDISVQKDRQRALTRIHESSRALIRAQTAEEICEVVVDAADELLNLSLVGVYLWDEAAGVLDPEAVTPATAELLGEVPTFGPGNSLAWDAFVDGETKVRDESPPEEDACGTGSEVRSEFAVPVGEYGVLLAGSVSDEGVSSPQVQFTETLAANATAALRRSEREQELQETEQELRRRNTSLARLDRINSIIRAIQRDIVRATTRHEIEQKLCEDLLNDEFYQFAWIGSYDESGELSPRAWAGDDAGFLDEITSTIQESDGGEPHPAVEALRTDSAVTIQRVQQELEDRPQLRYVLDSGFQSMMAAPLRFKDNDYGVLEIYAEKPAIFGEEEREILSEVRDFAANALNAIERRQALALKSDAEIEIEVGHVNDVVFRLARHADCTLTVTSMLPQSNGKWLLYLSVTGRDPEAFADLAEQQVAVEHATPLAGERGLFEVQISEFELATVLGEQGAKLHSIRANPDGGRVVVHVPQTTDLTAFFEATDSVLGDAKLVRKTPVSEAGAEEGAIGLPADLLTDRQRDVLEVAYRNGYFEWPRRKTGEEVADQLDISPPTFHRHVRTATLRMIERLFE